MNVTDPTGFSTTRPILGTPYANSSDFRCTVSIPIPMPMEPQDRAMTPMLQRLPECLKAGTRCGQVKASGRQG